MARRKPEALVGAFRKLKRARRKLNELEGVITQWLAREPCDVIQDSYPDECAHVLRTVLREEPDPDWALEVGEAMGHVREALDHLVQQLVTANGEEPSRRNAFPIYASEENFNRRKIAGVHPRWQAEIESLQPYGTPDPAASPLFRLNGIVQFGKHIDIHAIGVRRPQPANGLLVTIDGIPPDAEPGRWHFIDRGWDGTHIDGAEVHRVWSDGFVPEARLLVKEDMPIQVAFGEGDMTTSEMQEIVRIVGKILTRFEPAFEGP